jgi:hypothetical protein
MQTLPNPHAMERVFRKAQHLNLPNSTLVTLELRGFTGSCCDSGRLQVTDCGQWWYQCPAWGLKVSPLPGLFAQSLGTTLHNFEGIDVSPYYVC